MFYPNPESAVRALSASWRWPHFSVREFSCRCGGRFCSGQYWHDAEFLDALEDMRARAGRPLVLTSGHRCAGWNAAVGGAPLSRHKQIAADIRIAGHSRKALLDAAIGAGFTGFGLGRSFLHVDRRARPARWYYPGSERLWIQ